MAHSNRDFFEILSLCLRSRCPVCAQGRLFTPWRQARSLRSFYLPPERCDACGFVFAREAGYYLGVLTPTLPILSLAVGLFFVVIAFWVVGPDLAALLTWGGIGTAIGFVASFRTAIAVFIAFDHGIDPPELPQDSGK